MNTEVAWPIFIPLLSGVITLMFWRSRYWQRRLTLIGTGLLLAASLVLLSKTWQEGFVVLQTGSWPAPFGITLVADLLSAIMVVITGLMGFGIAIYSQSSIPSSHERFGYHPLLHLLLAGVTGSFLTGDIFNLFVWFEVMLLASFALLTLGGERAQMEGAIKYVTLNLFSSALFLSAIGLTYGLTGTLNMADLGAKLALVEHRGMVNVVALMFMISFGIKAAAFPLFFWLPASYHTPQVAVSAIFAGLLTKVGVYALYRLFTLVFVGDTGFTHTILLWSAALTMLTGVLGAAAQFEFRRILSFHIVSQIGYIMLGLALFTPLAIAGGIFYLVHNIIAKTNLFLLSGVTYRLLGSHDLRKLGGVYRERPGIAILFLISALGLAGIPPLSGFFAKFLLLKAAVEAESWLAVIAALTVSFMTLFSMLKIWIEVFWKALPEEIDGTRLAASHTDPGMVWLLTPIVVFAGLVVILGVWAEPLYEISRLAAAQLLNPAGYIEAVLGATP